MCHNVIRDTCCVRESVVRHRVVCDRVVCYNVTCDRCRMQIEKM